VGALLFLCTTSDTEQLKVSTHPVAISHEFVENTFINPLFITNSSDLSTDLFSVHESPSNVT